MGVHGHPRGTLDVGVNIFVELDELPLVLSVLHRRGAVVDDVDARARAERDGMFVARLDGPRVDVFVPSIPFSWEAARTRVRISQGERAYWFRAPEAVAVFKLLLSAESTASTSSVRRRARTGSITHTCGGGSPT